MMRVPSSIAFFLLLISRVAFGQDEDLDQATSPLALPFQIPEWLIPDYGGKLPFLATDNLASVSCAQEVRESSVCTMFGQDGVFVCRRIGGVVNLSVCTPDIEGKILGVRNDVCGCCGEPCPEQCGCLCNDGRGVLVETKVVFFWTLNVCVSHNIASYLTPGRPQINCDTSCLAD